MCGGDDHFAWKCLVSSKAYRGLCIAEGVDNRPFCIIDQTDMDSQAVTIDQLTATVASVQEIKDSLSQKPNSHQGIHSSHLLDHQCHRPRLSCYMLGIILRVIRELIRDPRGKFISNWSEPYFIRELIPEGVAWLMDLDGNRFSEPTNVDQLKKYYV
ncbi:hypothetical protein CK203_024899 [Vitis vinifera]|uniref:Uncharacterized protein n=1 Tax=Vitis vinifera TaxID=29760 RepID=A0A438J719_VITVI|nr:hypothetical protein CK203_024899 [Vitis vinifera]